MKKELKGFTQIFAFTFRQQVCRKGYLITTILVALLCLLIPAGVMMGSAWSDRGETEKQPEPENVVQEEENSRNEERDEMETETETKKVPSAVRQILVVNRTGSEDYSTASLERFDFEEILERQLPQIRWIEYGEDFEKAREDSAGTDDTLLLAADRQGDTFVLHLLYPEGSTLTEEDTGAISDGLSAYGDITATVMNETAAGEDGAATDETAGDDAGETETEDPLEGIRFALGFVIPYLNIMVLYFFVLLYGQGVAQSVITEKTSKLMEFFLISVRPSAMILGKLTAICLSGVIQLFSWLLEIGRAHV